MLYEDKINICTGPSNAENSAAQVDVVVPKETLSTAQLKKKEIRTRSSKRKNLGGKESTRGGEKRTKQKSIAGTSTEGMSKI
jgi:hypothetical protein